MRPIHALPISLLVCALAVPALAAAPDAAERVYERVGRAFDLESGRPLYVEVHRERYRAGRLVRDDVRYLRPGGELFAKKTIDYRHSVRAPSFRYEDVQSGRLEAVRRVRGGFEVLLRRARGQATERTRIDAGDVDAVDEGFHAAVRAGFRRLLAGDDVDVSLIYPSEQDEFTLRFEQRRTLRHEGRQLLMVDFEPASPFLRPFVSTSTLTYDVASGRVVEYRGVSNIRDRRGDPYSIRIRYDVAVPLELPASDAVATRAAP